MLSVYIYLALFITGHYACLGQTSNNRPIIGVLAQEVNFKEGYSYIAASYVKYLEGAGARVVPILINKTRSYYKDIVTHVNGVLFPGGGVHFTSKGGYAEAGEILFNLTIELNKDGDYFPLWGTCLGFELLTYIASGNNEHRARCLGYNQSLPLEFNPSSFQSKLFGDMPHELLGILVKDNVTANFHVFCVTEKNMTLLKLDNEWHFMTLNKDSAGMEYISSLEHRQYPIYAVQFHPEKNMYEWKEHKNYPHSEDAVLIAQHFANFFVNEARKNHHKFPSVAEERRHLIYNHEVHYTGHHTPFEQCYAFTD